MTLASINPTTEATVETFEALSEEQLESRLTRAQRAFEAHRRTGFEARAKRMLQVAQRLADEKVRLGRLMVEEMGKPLRAALAEVEKCAWVCRYYAEQAPRFLAREDILIEGQTSYLTFEPLGPVLAVMPWNFPFWQVFRFAAPTLMAGNVGLLKHASNVPRCALAIEEVFTRGGFESGEFQTLLIGSNRVAALIEDPRVAAVTLTGSEQAGSQVASAAGKAIKKTVMELGGSDPFIVLPSADLELAVSTAVSARLINNGQSCIAAKRFIVHERVYPQFEQRFVAALERVKMGDPMSEETELGPLATHAILQEVSEQVAQTVQRGARLLTGGKRADRQGYFYLPTAVTQIPKGSRLYEDEVFGPVAALFEVRDLDEAIAVANDHRYGLASSVWTREEDERERLIRELETGATFVNAMSASDPRLPFGGVKKSGYGRELGGEGIREFVNLKTVVIR